MPSQSYSIKTFPLSQYITEPNVYNKAWVQQQEQLFAIILNEVLQSSSSKADAWSDEEFEGVLKLAFDLYQSGEFQTIRTRLINAFKHKRLIPVYQCCGIRDLGVRSSIRNAFFKSYGITWLVIGLQVVTGRSIPLRSPKNRSPVKLMDAIMDQDGAVFTSLLLVISLDYLKSSISGPPLFQSKSNITSSAKMAVEISRLGLSGEGDTIRHLESITKWSFSQQQYPLDRFQYSITNVATDFRDGVRLTKLVELLSAKDSLTPLLQWPVNNSAQRIYNLNIALNAALSNGIELSTENDEIVDAKDIEMGHKEKTLAILGNLIHNKCLPQYLARTHLQEEVTALKMLCQLRRIKIPQLLVMEHPALQNPWIELLIEWTSLVFALENQPLVDFIAVFTTPQPIRIIIKFYLPCTSSAFIQENLKYLPWIQHTLAPGANYSQLVDVRIALGRLALLATKVLTNNDRVKAALIIQRAYRRARNAQSLSANTPSENQFVHGRETDRFVIALQSISRGYLLRRGTRKYGLNNASKPRRR